MNNNSGPSYNLVTTILNKLYTGDANRTRPGLATALDPVVFTQDKATNFAVNSTVQGGGNYFQTTTNDESNINQATMNAYATRQSLVLNFNQNLPISRTFMADQQLSSVSKQVQDRATAWRQSRDRAAFAVYGNGFTSQTTIDGTTVFSDTHTIAAGGVTIDNKETGVLNDDNLNTAVTSLRQQYAQGGYIAGYEPDFLLVPTNLHRTANAITKSILRAGSGNNDVNYWSDLFPGMKCVYSPFLSLTATTGNTAWFVGAENHGITRFDREGFFTDLVDWKYNANDEYIYKMRSREVVDSIFFNGLVGSTGAA